MMEYWELVGLTLLVIAGIIGIAALIGAIAQKRKLPQKPVVSETPKPEPAPQPPPEPYTHNQYQSDLHNPDISISDMLDQMQGEIPEDPPEVPVQGAQGPQGTYPGSVMKSPCEDKERSEERQEWFKEVAKEAAPVEIKDPPPMQGPVMTVKGQLVPCQCSSGGPPVTSNPLHGPPRPGRVRGVRCEACRDSGWIFLQHG